MSRSFYPPDTLSKDNVRTIADVRRDIWTSGFQGLAIGSIGGYFLHSTARLIYNRLPEASKLKAGGGSQIRFTRNTAWLSVMAGGALGSYVLATAAGKNRVHNLHDIYEVGKKEPGTEYQRSLARAADREEEIRERLRRRMSRRETVRKRLEEGQGLSNSHGGHWIVSEGGPGGQGVEDDKDAAIRRRLSRRRTVHRRLEEGHGLSDSHGGHWVDGGKRAE